MNGCKEIRDYSDGIAAIAYEFAGRRPPRKEYTALPALQSDTELITQIQSSRSGVKFNALYRGDTSGYPSHSHAESALVFMLAWWTQSPAQIDGIVRLSGLIRPKWDERRGSTTYGSRLIDEALSTVSPRQERKAQENYL
jgi:putative DNA primase/helicase